MIVKLVSAGLLLTLCLASRLQYPVNDPCILIDVDANISLSWTDTKGKEFFIPNWNFTGSTVHMGSCNDSSPFLEVIWAIDNGTMRFTFNKVSSTVNVDIVLSIVPEKVFGEFNNTDNSTVDIKTTLRTGAVGKAYKCDAEEELKANSSDNVYKMTLRLKNLEMQGFGVMNGSYTEVDECGKDTTTPTTLTTPTTEVTTQTTNGTMPTTEVTTQTTHGTTPKPSAPNKVTMSASNGTFTCAVLSGKFTLIIPYNRSDGKQDTVKVFVPDSVSNSTTGSCGTSTDNMTATFFDNWELHFVFTGDSDSTWWQELDVTVYYDNETFPGINASLVNTNKTFSKAFSDKMFKASKQGSYLCNADSTLDLDSGLKLETQEMQYMALQNNVTKFPDNNVSECSADSKTSSIVPIAVGAALAGLVVIVLIAYLIGRKRNRKGYESV